MKSILGLLPLLLPALTGQAALTVTNIASGNFAYHSLFLKSDGSLWVMGYNNSGQLGDGTLNRTNRSEQIVAGGVTTIAAGGYHSLFLKSDGSLWAMGQNNFGQLGDGTLTRTMSAVDKKLTARVGFPVAGISCRPTPRPFPPIPRPTATPAANHTTRI
jgi:alpha-tubulin suppressor-like RCC1 family protein